MEFHRDVIHHERPQYMKTRRGLKKESLCCSHFFSKDEATEERECFDQAAEEEIKGRVLEKEESNEAENEQGLSKELLKEQVTTDSTALLQDRLMVKVTVGEVNKQK